MNRDALTRRRKRLWRAWFNGLIYVPSEQRPILDHLDGGPAELLEELEKLSSLKSPWASATLAYLALVPGPDGTRNTERAEQLCKSHSSAGDAYAQYIHAWALLYANKPDLAYGELKKSMLSGFPPAKMDFANFLWNGYGTRERYFALALRALSAAERVGHTAALQWRAFFYRSGHVGAIRVPLGYMLAPVGRVRYVLSAWRDPFSSRVFVFQTGATGPLLRTEPRFQV